MKRIIILAVFMLMLVDPASATVWGSDGAIKLVDEGNINSTTLESKLDAWLTKNPSYGNVEYYINQTSEKVWVYRKRVECGNNSTLVFDSSDDCTEVRLGKTIGSSGGHVEFGTMYETGYGKFVFRNVTVIGWNETSGTMIPLSEYADMTQIDTYHATLDNVTFKAIRGIYCYNDISNITEVSVEDSYKGIMIVNISNTDFSNIKCRNIIYTGLALSSCKNCELSDYIFYNDPSFRNTHATSSNGLSINNGHSNYVHDLNIESPRWGGIYISGVEHNTIVKNVTVNYAGHNGIDVHGGYNLTIENITVNDSYSNDFIISSSSAHDIIFRDISTYSPSASGVSIADNANNVTINKISVGSEPENPHNGIKMMGCSNITVIGLNDIWTTTTWEPTTYDGLTTEDIVLIDASLYNSSYKDIWIQKSIRAKLLNVRYGKASYDSSTDFYNAYYLDMITKYEDGTSVPNTKLIISSNISDYQSQNGYARDKTIFFTNSEGHTYLPNDNRANSPAINEYHRNPDGTYDYLPHTISIITQSSLNISLSGITPDSSWYREDPNVPTYTITAIIPDDLIGPHKTGFAPSEENPFNTGDKKIFRVWTDEPLTNMKWYVDDVDEPVNEGAMSYTWTVEEGGHTIKFVGSNANGTVNQTWNIGEDSGALPKAVIEFFPTDTTLTQNTDEPVTFSVNSDQPLTTNWFINGEMVQSDAASITRTWDTPGTYEVMVTGSSGEESILHIWIVDVIGSVEPQNTSIVTVIPEYQTSEYQLVAPNQPFTLDVEIEPGTAIAGSQLDLRFNGSMVSANGVTEGNLFSQAGASTFFSSGTTDNTAGKVGNVYGSILGESSVSSPGVMATISMTAGNMTGYIELKLSNVIVSDSNSNPAPITINNATVLIDTAPELNPIGSKSIGETKSLTFTVNANDMDGDKLTYSAAGLPEGAYFDPASGQFIWTPSQGQAGTYTVTFEVSDGYLTDSEDVTITVNPALVIDSFEPDDGSVFTEKDKINIIVRASAAAEQPLSYVIKIDGITCSTDSSYVWNTGFSSSGTHTIEVAVSDGTDQVTDQHTIYINDYQPRWDVNKDKKVDILDVTVVAQKYGTTTTEPYPAWDVNEDGSTNIQDLSIVGYYFGETIE
ncbi:putative Ig domain-containing protein [Methanosarcina sp. KYL-1]|uniref:putative Ig domain-containing protein n=1 Tax=Methanosarcina sp. KYL-1 TaxID=2602068 RepID=UPI002101B89B|nr:putative Ig domain-containing protein [Methanosarcina sp. KYL-1]